MRKFNKYFLCLFLLLTPFTNVLALLYNPEQASKSVKIENYIEIREQADPEVDLLVAQTGSGNLIRVSEYIGPLNRPPEDRDYRAIPMEEIEAILADPESVLEVYPPRVKLPLIDQTEEREIVSSIRPNSLETLEEAPIENEPFIKRFWFHLKSYFKFGFQ